MIMQINYGARGHWWLIERGSCCKEDAELTGWFEDEEHALEAARERIATSRVPPSTEEVDVILVNPDGWGHCAHHELLKRPVVHQDGAEEPGPIEQSKQKCVCAGTPV